jgi:hypothetical protein
VSHRRSALAAACACALALLTPVAAQAAGGGVSPLLFEREFVVELSGRLTTTFTHPRSYGFTDCSGREWTEGHEEELLTFRSRRPVRIGAVAHGTGDVSFIRTDSEVIDIGVPAGGSLTRDVRWTRGREAGTCGGEQPGVVDLGDDCGTKMVDYDVALDVHKGGLAIVPHAAREAPPDMEVFHDCRVLRPSRAEDGGWDDVRGRISARQLWHGTKAVTVKGTRTWTEPFSAGSKDSSTMTTSFTVRLTPVARKGARRKT